MGLYLISKKLVGVNTYTHGGELLNFAIGVNDLNEFLYEKINQLRKKITRILKRKKRKYMDKKKKRTNKFGRRICRKGFK